MGLKALMGILARTGGVTAGKAGRSRRVLMSPGKVRSWKLREFS